MGNPKEFRRTNGAPYDPNPANVRQYEEQYGPGGVPEGYAIAAVTPLQDPTAIRVAACFLTLFAGGMLALGFHCLTVPDKAGTGIWSIIVGLAAIVAACWAFVIAGRRKRWLQERENRQTRSAA